MMTKRVDAGRRFWSNVSRWYLGGSTEPEGKERIARGQEIARRLGVQEGLHAGMLSFLHFRTATSQSTNECSIHMGTC